MAAKKGMKMTSFQEDRVRNIERKLDSEEISISKAITDLQVEFGYHFDKDDYKEIEKKLEGR
jgi:hypothetical protein